PSELEDGYWQAYRDFYSWGSILRSSCAHPNPVDRLRHFAYAAGWKKFEPLWDWVIRARKVANFLPLLESILAGFRSLEVNRQSLPVNIYSPRNIRKYVDNN
ncbi:MAG: hypothetical protein JSV69_04810, partial [Chloroflexota bacterium]